MFSGGPPVHLMWSNMFNPDKAKLKGKVAWRRIAALFAPYWRLELMVVAAIIVSLGVNWLIARSIVRRLRLIQIAAERISYAAARYRGSSRLRPSAIWR